MPNSSRKSGGPGLLIAAAFIGPGTVTVCTLAGAQYGYSLLWVLLIATLVTIFLQDIAARLGIVTRLGLTSLVKNQITQPTLKMLSLGLILAAIVIGNASYEAGNISGAVLGIDALFGTRNFGPIIIGALAFTLLITGSYKIIEKALIALVVFMSFAFLVTAFLTAPDLGLLITGVLVPSIPDGGLLIVLGLVGTTIVPYNLFLHASLASEKWQIEDLALAKKDTIIAVALGGLVSMAILVCAASIPEGTEIKNAAGLASGLTILYGDAAKYLLSLGLFAAGITSAITAPLAAAYVTAGVFGWSSDLKSSGMRLTWMIILALGVIFSSSGYKPIDVIRFAQIANGALLPIIVGFILWLSAKRQVLGAYKNKPWQTIVGVFILVLMLSLGIKSILLAF